MSEKSTRPECGLEVWACRGTCDPDLIKIFARCEPRPHLCVAQNYGNYWVSTKMADIVVDTASFERACGTSGLPEPFRMPGPHVIVKMRLILVEDE